MRDHGAQAEKLAAHYGISLPSDVCDFSASLNPMGMPPSLQDLSLLWPTLAGSYPQADAERACEALAQAHDLLPKQVFCGNGSNDLFTLTLLAYGATRAYFVPPCWSGYAECCMAAGIPSSGLQGSYQNWTIPQQERSAVFLASPNNPDGQIWETEQVIHLCHAHPQALFLLDLAFDDFLQAPEDSPWWQKRPWPENLVRIKSLTKFFALPGLRLGFAATGQGPQVDALLHEIHRRQLPWSTNALAQWCALRLYADRKWMDQSRDKCAQLSQELLEILSRNGFTTQACPAWVLAQGPELWSAQEWQRHLLEQGIAVRLLQSETPHDLLRFGLRPSADLQKLEQTLQALRTPSVQIHKTPCRALLVAGTGSDAWKSAVTTGLCAVLHRAGLRPFPYKAQNMSNHAWV
ncbi:MAG TPA: aminotransferase class I/II-fold pyridoxal phosphate-dependent enzyme, partial [Fibrobacteraceae bacterium]|nr:aminotransferase class I/II-fold pyridoxal phosphate-dependent enzyme [Fibrobacteraceae bacterium]